LLKENRSLLETDVSIKIRVNRAFGRNYSSRDRIRSATSIIWDNTNIQKATAPVNGNFPMYTFSTDGLETLTNQSTVAKNALEMINVTPNPYYAYSDYETSQLDNRVKIINLPQKCTIAIYTVNGTLIRRITKDDNATTYIDWDMKNQANIPVASGLYLIHVEVPEVGEKVLKWFGAMRPIDLDSF
jgi:flagellar hook assembly protein FlgD